MSPHQLTDHRFSSGLPYPLGATCTATGVNFALYSQHASLVHLELFDTADGEATDVIPLGHRDKYVWHVHVEGLRAGQLYGYRVSGEYRPELGLRLITEPDPSYHGVNFWDAFGGHAKAVAPGMAFSLKARCGMLRDTGACLSPFNAQQFLLGLETLPLRARQHVANAAKVAEFLSKHPSVSWVNYPGLASHPDYQRAKKYFPQGAGAINRPSAVRDIQPPGPATRGTACRTRHPEWSAHQGRNRRGYDAPARRVTRRRAQPPLPVLPSGEQPQRLGRTGGQAETGHGCLRLADEFATNVVELRFAQRLAIVINQRALQRIGKAFGD